MSSCGVSHVVVTRPFDGFNTVIFMIFWFWFGLTRRFFCGATAEHLTACGRLVGINFAKIYRERPVSLDGKEKFHGG
jgi:hypothetical protein